MIRALFPLLFAAACASSQPAAVRTTPLIAYHQHLIRPATAELWGAGTTPTDAAELIGLLDSAQIEQGLVLSVGYTWGDERKNVADHQARTRDENDWTAEQVARFPTRLRGFCSVNPLLDYAEAEIERCLRLPGMIGVKLHIGNSGVNMRDPAHVARLAAFFRFVNAQGAAIAAHVRARSSLPYGAEDAQIFLDQVLPAAPDIVVQIAHFAGSGPGFRDNDAAAMAVYANAIAAGDPRTRNLYFDITTIVTPQTDDARAALITAIIRQIGVQRVLFGSDLPRSGNPPPAEAWAILRARLPLTEAEFSAIAGNVAPYWR